ncbi:serine/threonine-protein phosphatase 6 regulatory ankyrin repeat subunit B-like isoform X4 [Haliotis rufescens]|uniref:serine/threonine-protein phosphatase 6 regulatory ankyrin repeat subunit B-like isoform X4 n=1 Tax=Haliotis rufescens TaxID=6454 RepID=UPI00201F0ECB|nr:serine/threonine-protein phosphatase 6 regulatory ankyrin repeat subunit B-like isoform X4 [Haliotis rufescens]
MSSGMSSSTSSDESDEEPQIVQHVEKPDIHKMARQGEVEKLRNALGDRRRGVAIADIDEKDGQGLTALQHAVKCNRPEVVRLLVNWEKPANHLIQDQHGLSLAHYATKSVRGTTRNAPDTYNDSGKDDRRYSKQLSISSDDKSAVTCLEILIYKDMEQNVAEGKEPGKKETKMKLIYLKEKRHGQTPLHFAVMSGSLDSVRILIKKDKNPKQEQLIHTKDKHDMTPMHVAATYRQVDIMDFLLDNGAEITQEDKEGSIPLHYACSTGCLEMVNLLIAKGKSEIVTMVEKKAMGGNTCLHIAIENGHEGIIQKLLQNDSKVLVARDDGMLPVHLAVISGNLNVVKSIVSKAGLHQRDTENKAESTTLHLAAQYNQLEVARYLLEKSSSLVAKTDSESNTPLHVAAFFNHWEIIGLLMEKGGKINAKNLKGQIPLHVAAEMGHMESLKVLLNPRSLKHGKDFMELKEEENGEFIFKKLQHIAKQEGNSVDSKVRKAVEDVRQKLEKEAKPVDDRIPTQRIYRIVQALGPPKERPPDVQEKNARPSRTSKVKPQSQASSEKEKDSTKYYVKKFLELIYTDNIINTEDNIGNTALHLAAQNGHTEIVKKMLEKHKAEHGRKNDSERTALHLAAEKGHTQTVGVIVARHKQGVFAEDQDRNTPLHLAAKGGHKETVQLLVKNGADMNQMNVHGMTPLDLAAKHGEVEICEMLARKDPHTGLKGCNECPLHLACREGHLNVAMFLLQTKADMTHRNSGGLNCLDLAIMHGHKDIARYILRHDLWREALRNHVSPKKKNKRSSRKIVTPMRRLIRDMPDLAYEVLERSVTTTVISDGEKKKEEKTYNFEFVDDLYENWAIPKKKKQKCSDSELKAETVPYTHKATVIKKNHPLSIMVECNRDELLQHPLVNKLVKKKWWHFGAYYYLANFGVHLLFVILLTRYMLKSTHPLSYTNAASINDNICDRSISPWLLVEKILLYVLMGLGAVFEILQMFNMRAAYLSDLESYVEWVSYICTFLLLLEFSECTTTTGYRQEWQWSLGAFAVFFAWIDLVLYLKAFTSLGLYVIMFQLVCWTFLKVFLVFFSLILAFSLGFHILLQNQVGLAVGDIQGIQRRAAFKRTAMHVELVLDVEKVLFNTTRAKLYKKRYSTKKKKSKTPWLWRKFMALPCWWWNQRVEKQENTVLESIEELTRQQKRLESMIGAMNSDMLVLLRHNDPGVRGAASVGNGPGNT